MEAFRRATIPKDYAQWMGNSTYPILIGVALSTFFGRKDLPPIETSAMFWIVLCYYALDWLCFNTSLEIRTPLANSEFLQMFVALVTFGAILILAAQSSGELPQNFRYVIFSYGLAATIFATFESARMVDRHTNAKWTTAGAQFGAVITFLIAIFLSASNIPHRTVSIVYLAGISLLLAGKLVRYVWVLMPLLHDRCEAVLSGTTSNSPA